MKKIILLLVFLFPFSSFAISFQAQKVLTVAKTSTGAQVAVSYAGRTAANQAVYAIRSVPVSKQVIANVIRTRSFNPWGIAVVAGITAAGYYLDTSTNSVVKDGITIDPNISGTCSGPYTNSFNCVFSDIPSVISTTRYYNPSIPAGDEPTAVTPTYWYWSPPNTSALLARFYSSIPLPDPSVVGGTVPVSDDELYDNVIPLLSPQEFNDLFEDVYSSKPNPNMQPLYDPIPDLNSDYEAANDGNPATIPTFDPSVGDTGTDSLSDNPPEDKDPCVINPLLLSCMQNDDVPQSQPVQTIEYQASYSSHFFSSNATCPAPIQLPYGEMSYQPACDFATGFRPVVLIVFTIIGLVIFSGTKV